MCCAAAVAAVLLLPQAAPAAVSCNYDVASNALNVTLTAAGDKAHLNRSGNGEINLGGMYCGGATVMNTDSIVVTDSSGGDTTVTIGSGFAPGYTSEGGPGSEIEFSVNLGGGIQDIVRVRGGVNDTTVAFGKQGINLNTGVELGSPDSDVQLTGVERLGFDGYVSDEWVTGQGGFGTGQPTDLRLDLSGGEGNDELYAGAAGYEELRGGPGDDILLGAGMHDVLAGDAGNDTIAGGGGSDTASYRDAPAGVSVDLLLAGPQDTGGAGVDMIVGVESLEGSKHDDTLSGDAGYNTLDGGPGGDLLNGRTSFDWLWGGPGDDTLRTGAGDDEASGDDGTDRVVYDDAAAAVKVDLAVTAAQPTGGSGAETLTEVEAVTGSAFADVLTGSTGPNALHGGAGADAIDGREGSDTLAGGAGSDTIEARDTSADSISCAEGPDTVTADALDTVAADCAPAPLVSGAPPARPGTALGLSVVVPRQSLRSVRTRGLRVTLRCSAHCRAGGLLLADRRTARRLGLGSAAANRRLGRLAPAEIAAGGARSTRIRLTRKARRALGRVRDVRLVLRARAVDGTGGAAATARKRVRLSR